MKKTISFGKIDFNRCGRKNNAVEVELRLEHKSDNQVEFAACISVYNSKHTDVICSGQCFNDIAEYINDPLFSEILSLWKKYHLNTMHAGTVEQEAALKAWNTQGNRYTYIEACEYLKSIGLYEVEYHGKPYRYGTSWLYHEIPEADLARIEHIMK